MGLFSFGIPHYASLNNIDKVKKLLAKGRDANERYTLNMTALHMCVRKDLVEMAELLLDNGIDMNASANEDITPLHFAIQNGAHGVALALIRRGAEAERPRYQGLTPLQVAIQVEAVDIVKELLESGAADPNVDHANGATTLSFVEKCVMHKDEFRRLVTEFMNMENGLAAHNEKAIGAILRRSIRRKQYEEAIVDYLKAAGAGAAVNLETYKLTLLQWTLENGHLHDFLRVLMPNAPESAGMEELKGMAEVPTLVGELRFGETQWTALHVAAASGNQRVVAYLLFEVQQKPTVSDAEGKLPIEVVSDDGDPEGIVRETLQLVMDKLSFDDALTRTLTVRSRSIERLNELAVTMTSIQDLQVLLTLAQPLVKTQSEAVTRQLIPVTFKRVMDAKLVLDDHDALFFQKVLKHCKSNRLLTDDEYEYWKLQLVKVNMESAVWAVQLKKRVSSLEWRVTDVEHNTEMLRSHFETLREALVRQEQQRQQAEEMEEMVSAISLALTFVAGPLVRSLFDNVVTLDDPMKLFLGVFDVTEDSYRDYVRGMFEEKVLKDLVVRGGMEHVLHDAKIEPVELAKVLSAAIEFNKTVDSTEGAVAVTPTVLPPVMSALPVEKMMLEDSSTIQVHELESYPFHDAVHASKGDVNAYLSLIEYIEDSETAINATTTLVVPVEGGKTDKIDADAGVYASYLGYVDIVKWFLDQPSRHSSEKKFETMKRAQMQSQGVAQKEAAVA